MTIADIQWDKSDLYIVIAFSSGCFCVVSRLGQIINLITPKKSIRAFYSFGGSKATSYNRISISNNSIFSYSDEDAIQLRMTIVPSIFDVAIDNSCFGRSNSILRLLLADPKSCLNQTKISILEESLKNDVHYIKPNTNVKVNLSHDGTNAEINFVDPFPNNPSINYKKLIATTIKLIEPLRWSNDYSSNIIEVIAEELNKSAKMLFRCKV